MTIYLEGRGVKADCIYARVHMFFFQSRRSREELKSRGPNMKLSAMFTRPRSKKKWASVEDRFKSFAPFRLMGDSKNYLRSF